jgi:outer membrane murein-binding lipoprotein Lpp
MRASLVVTVVLCLVLQACSSEASLTDYADQLEGLVTTMNARLDALDAEVEGTQDLDQVKGYARERVEARSDFIDGLRSLDPPEEVAELHTAALEIMSRLTKAESVLAERVQGMETSAGIDSIWDTPEGVAARAADEQAVALCRAAEAEINSTEERSTFEDVPWIPAEMKEIVRVAFGCDAENR